MALTTGVSWERRTNVGTDPYTILCTFFRRHEDRKSFQLQVFYETDVRDGTCEIESYAETEGNACHSSALWETESTSLHEVENRLAGKKVALFGSYDWGDGEWMRTWEARCKDAGIELAAEGLIANNTPDDEAVAACRALGGSLAE